MILAAVINHDGNPHHIASAPLGDRVIIKSISIREKDIIIDMIKHGPYDPDCCPTQREVVRYGLFGSKLIKK